MGPRSSPDVVAREEHTVIPHLEVLDEAQLALLPKLGAFATAVDVYAIALQHKPLPELLELYRRKYPTSDVAHMLMALVYFEDAEEEPSPLMLYDVSWDEIKSRFREWVASIDGGFKRSDCPGSPNGIRAWTIDEFFSSFTSFAVPPAQDRQWLLIADEALYHVTNGEVFY